MKRILLLIFGTFSFLGLMGQDLVTTQAQKKSVVLEEFTGLNCTFCPDGHRIANEMKDANPNRVILVNVHAGSFASPGSGQPDYRVDEGVAFDNFVGVGGYPSGTVNRRMVDGDLDYSRSLWASLGDDLLQESSPVNVGAMTSYDEMTRTLTVVSEVYYTANSPEPTNRLIIALMQNNIIGPQVGAARNPDDVVGSQYRHGHMLRDYLTGEFGLEIPMTTAGTVFRDTQVYQIPDMFRDIPVVVDDLELGVYVANTQTDIQNGVLVGLNDMDDGNNAPIYIDYSGLDNLAKNITSAGSGDFSTEIFALYPGTENYSVQVDAVAPSDWVMEYTIGGNTYSGDATVSMDQNIEYRTLFNVQPGSSGVGTYMITIFPNSDRDAEIVFEFTALYDCADLLINGESTRGDGQNIGPAGWESYYNDAFVSNGTQKFGATNSDVWKALAANNDLEGINNIYLNIGWTFPAYTDAMVDALIPFMEAGGNIFVAGQDIAWDIMANTNPARSAYSRNFLNNYLNVDYVGDGDASNNPVTADADGIFSDMADFQLSDYYGGSANNYFYPDQLGLRADSRAAFNYNNTNRIGAVYGDNGTYKVVYFGFGLEMIDDVDTRNALMQRVYDYFYGIVNNEDLDLATGDIRVVPNPISNHTLTFINDSEHLNIPFTVVDGIGRTIYNGVTAGTGVNSYELSGLRSGVYFLNFQVKDELVSKPFVKN